jgi:hypothetical protein
MGKRNSIKGRDLVKNPDVYFVGCPCNMAHNATRKGSDSFSGSSVSSGINVEDLVVDLDFNYYWIDKGTKRKNKLSEFCIFCDTTYFTDFEACIHTLT